MTLSKQAQLERDQERDNAIAHLRELLNPGDEVSTILNHVSRSGMSRSISLVVGRDRRVRKLDYWAARAVGCKIDQTRGGLVVGGCGMDMGFHLVYSLSQILWPDGWECIGEPENEDGRREYCPANDHHNPPYPARVAGSMVHKDGGYALNHSWL